VYSLDKSKKITYSKIVDIMYRLDRFEFAGYVNCNAWSDQIKSAIDQDQNILTLQIVANGYV
jgi:hypothetical protein